MTAASIEAERDTTFAEVARLWWIFLMIGTAWIIFAITVFRFDWRTVSAISLLFGVVMIATAFEELFTAFAERGRRQVALAHLLVALVYLAIGVIAFVHPGNTFAALGAVISFYFVIAGMFRIAFAFLDRTDDVATTVSLLVGIVQVMFGIWAAGDFGRRTILLVVWVGVVALSRGIDAYMFAFALRDAGRHPSAVGPDLA